MKMLKDFLEKDIEARDAMSRLLKPGQQKPVGCQKELLEKIESYGDQLMDFAVKQNREIQKMKEAMKR